MQTGVFQDVEPFHYSDEDLTTGTKHWDDKEYDLSEFDKLLRGKWDKCMKDGFFRYHLDKVETKIIPGEKKYVAQLNVKRATERRKPQEIITVNQPFDENLFNFSRIKSNEVLFLLDKKTKSPPDTPKVEEAMCNGTKDEEPQNLVIINVSPLEYGHVLLVPDVYSFRPQMLTEYSIQLAIETLLLSRHQGFRIGFNSLCAFASVNHQHLHAYYLEQELFVESCPVKHLKGILYELEVMPTKGFVFQLHGSTVEDVSRVVYLVADYMQRSEIAHNLFMTRGTVFGEDRTSRNRTIRLFLWPRKKFIGVKEEACFNVAVVELAGHLPIKIAEMYEGLTEETVNDTIRSAQLDEAEYQTVKDNVLQLYKPTCSSS
ncbi:GDP-D-glucose phosphorylase 1-like [Mizuhopecten yessoensis]|uniref:GDP-D-glucose phosphorylase 1-like n=1 Tax=Mizuhopecten yessoensis TaxID=6573 RepID=UPI000B45A11A|nr:GDP-D-glucose phosphorylase 1-like [Mizuhopecten yessoensis]